MLSGTTALSVATSPSTTRVTPSSPTETRPSLLETLETSPFEYDDAQDVLANDDLEMVQLLQKSSQADVLSSEEQALAQADTPESFLAQLGGETPLEHMAMSSVTEQLPQASLSAFTKQQRKAKRAADIHYSNTPRMTKDQELQLGRIIQTGAAAMAHENRDDPKAWAAAAGYPSPKALRRTIVAYRQAKHVLVTSNMGLVHAVVNQLHKTTAATKDELVQEGTLGLLRAAELFDPTRGLRFSTYAVVWIKGMLSNSHALELVRVPWRQKTQWNKICKAQQELIALDKPTQPTDIARVTGLTVEQVLASQQRHSQVQNMASLDASVRLQTRSGSNAVQRDEPVSHDDDGLAELTLFRADLVAALTRNLDAREARLMRLRYGLTTGRDRTLTECAEAMGLSYSSVQRLNKQCLAKLREAEEFAALQEYLLTIA